MFSTSFCPNVFENHDIISVLLNIFPWTGFLLCTGFLQMTVPVFVEKPPPDAVSRLPQMYPNVQMTPI